jgi:hypothetical protein
VCKSLYPFRRGKRGEAGGHRTLKCFATKEHWHQLKEQSLPWLLVLPPDYFRPPTVILELEYPWSESETELCSWDVSIFVLYSGGLLFDFWFGDFLSWLKYFVFISSSGKTLWAKSENWPSEGRSLLHRITCAVKKGTLD